MDNHPNPLSLLNLDNQYIINPLSLHAILNFSFFFVTFRFVSIGFVSFRFVFFATSRFVTFRFVSFRFDRFRFVRFRFVSISFRTLQVPFDILFMSCLWLVQCRLPLLIFHSTTSEHVFSMVQHVYEDRFIAKISLL